MRSEQRVNFRLVVVALVGALIVGYHPYAEDGGIYLAEVKRVLDPGLYPLFGGFVSGHLGSWHSFADGVAWMVRLTGLPLAWVMVALHVAFLWVLLAAVWALAAQSYAGAAARWGAAGLVAMCWGMPVAGTSLMLVDPYLTARSGALAGTVAGFAGVAGFALTRHWWRLAAAVVALGLAVAAHPLMGGYGSIEAVVLACLLSPRRGVRAWGTAGAVLAAALAVCALQATGPLVTADYMRVAASRYYWFPGEWHWYELLGIVAPVAILGWAGWRGRGLERGLSWMAVVVGGTSMVLTGWFAREGAKVYAVARLQPLRCFQIVYLTMLMALGAWLGENVLRGAWWRWAVAGIVLAGGMFASQRATYPASIHLELPGVRVVNRWEEAFLWVRENTPRDALFGLDADYVQRAGEDAQGFRAVAERSALPDYSKDGGQAAIRPELTSAWMVGQAAQAGLTGETDAERVAKLKPLGVTWLVMGQEAATRFVCPYKNALVKVCRLGG